MRLGIAHAAVEFKRLDFAARRDHQARVQETGITDAVFFHASYGRQNHLAHRSRMHLRRDDRRGRVCAHATSVRPLVTIGQALVILARCQRRDVFAIAQHDETGLFADEILFDHDARSGLSIVTRVVLHAIGIRAQHVVHSGVSLVQTHGNNDPFASGQPICFDHYRRAFLIDVGMGGQRIGKGFKLSRRDTMARHEGFAECLRAFKLRGSLSRPKDTQTLGTKRINDTRCQRRFGANYRKSYLFSSSECR